MADTMRTAGARALALLAAAMLLTGCGGDQPTSPSPGTPTTATTPASPAPPAEPQPTPPAAPAPTACSYSLATVPSGFEREGGNGSLRITTAAGCRWTIARDGSWLAIDGATEGEGPATLKVSVQPNDGDAQRRLTLTVGNASFTVSQSGQEDCTFQVTPVTAVIPQLRWNGDITVTTAPGCRWTASADAPWLRLGRAGATGSATLRYDADFNPATAYAAQRTATVAIRWAAPTAGQNVRINQWGTCNVALAAPPEGTPGFSGYPGGTVTAGPDGGRVHLFVLTDPFMGCAWSVESTDTWISVDSPKLHEVRGGDGDLYFTVPANPLSSSRRAVLNVGDRALTIVQQGR
jgi:hypothetical protein